MLWTYAETLYRDDCATLEDLREAVTTLEDTERIARRVLGGSHPDACGLRKTCGTREPRSARARDTSV